MISVIIPNYNHCLFLNKRISSVIDQSYQNFEVIILDDNSTDKSKKEIEKYRNNPKISKIIYNETNSGSTFKQWKKGIEQCQGEYIWIAESDDFCDKDFLSKAIQYLSNDNIDLFYCKSIRVNEKGEFLDELEWWYKDISKTKWNSSHQSPATLEIKEFLSKKNIIPNASAVVFKNNKQIIQYLDYIENFKYCGDWFFWLQYLRDADKICYDASVKNYFRTHNSTTRSSPKSGRNNEIIEIYKWLMKEKYLSKELSPILYYLQYHLILYPRKKIILNLPIFIKLIKINKNAFWAILKWNLRL